MAIPSSSRADGKLNLLIRWSPENLDRIEQERAFVGPLRERDRGHYSGRLGASDWIGSRWDRWGNRRKPSSGVREKPGSRPPKALVGEWRWVWFDEP